MSLGVFEGEDECVKVDGEWGPVFDDPAPDGDGMLEPVLQGRAGVEWMVVDVLPGEVVAEATGEAKNRPVRDGPEEEKLELLLRLDDCQLPELGPRVELAEEEERLGGWGSSEVQQPETACLTHLTTPRWWMTCSEWKVRCGLGIERFSSVVDESKAHRVSRPSVSRRRLLATHDDAWFH